MKKTIAFASAIALSATGAIAGGLDAVVVEEEPQVVVPAASPSLGGLGLGAVAAGVAGVAVLAAVIADDDDDDDDDDTGTTTTLEED